MKKVVVFGTTDFAEVLSYWLEKDDRYEIAAYTLHQKYLSAAEKTFRGYPLVAFETLSQVYPPSTYELFLCIGYKQMNQHRRDIWEQAKKMGYRIASYQHPSSIVEAQELGEGNIFMEGTILGAYTQVGKGNVFYPAAHIAHHTKIGNFNFFAVSCAVAGHVQVGDFCFVGNNSTIRNGIQLQDYTLVGAGSYLAHDSPSHSVIVPPKSVLLDKDSLKIDL